MKVIINSKAKAIYADVVKTFGNHPLTVYYEISRRLYFAQLSWGVPNDIDLRDALEIAAQVLLKEYAAEIEPLPEYPNFLRWYSEISVTDADKIARQEKENIYCILTKHGYKLTDRGFWTI